MGSGVRRTRDLAITAVIAVCLLAAVATPPARAGEIWAAEGNMNGGLGCGAFAAGGDFGVYPGYGTPIFTAPSACPMSIAAGSIVPAGQNAYWMTTAPPGVTIVQAFTNSGDVASSGIDTGGWIVGDFWQNVSSGAWGGSTLASGQTWFNTGLEGSSNINSQIYGIQLVCTLSVSCLGFGPPEFSVSGIELEGVENSAPYVTGQGALWASGSWVWNPPGDPWPVTLYASDVSGICSSYALVNSSAVNGPSEPRNTTVWQQCPNPVSWTFPVDTRSQVSTAGSFQIGLSATNAAAVGGLASPGKTVSVDNDPVGVSFRTPNDANPTVWVNHAVSVDATATAGPSGVGGMKCGVDRGAATSYPAAGLTVNGDGVHTVTCTAWNKAVDPQGQPNTNTNSMSVHIDEAPPTITFASQNPHDPTGLVVNASDTESGVADGSIEMAPAGTNNWTSLPTSSNGSRLAAHFDDAGRIGPYSFRATACDNVGNCASATEQLALPLRTASDSQVSLTKIVNPLRRRTVFVRVKRRGRIKTIKVVKYVEQCSTKRVRTGSHGWRVKRICRSPRVRTTTTLRVPYGRSVTVHGLYTTRAGSPLPGQPVDVFAAPNNDTNAFSQVATATTAANGSWSATIPPGPSRIIRAVTNGTATILPSSGQVTTIVPAKVRLVRVWPRRVAWGGTVHLVGQLLGGYLPPGGALVRLRIGYGSTYETYGVEEHVSGNGRFSTVASFGPGDPSISRTYWFQIASLPMGNYPYAPAASQRVPVTVGGHP